MRKMKKINGYLVVRFNDWEKREHEGTALGNFGVIDAALRPGRKSCVKADKRQSRKQEQIKCLPV